MKIGLIADDFTRINLEMEAGVTIVNLSPKSWRIDLALNNIDVLLVESAWRGFKGRWQRKIAKYESQNLQLNKLIAYCRGKKIPSIFWNKEDPVNYERFKHNLHNFDICLTTEEAMIPQYKKSFNNLKDIALMPFFFQPKLHNPHKGEVLPLLDQKVIFCGGLYSTEFPDRASRLKQGIDFIGGENVVVYDRFNSNDTEWNSISGIEVASAFSYKNSKKHYQSGLAQINVNSFDGSSTMFSRRMLELIACGAHVIDLTAYKGKGVLSQYVTQVSNKNDMIKAFEVPEPRLDFDNLVEHYGAGNFINTLKSYI